MAELYNLRLTTSLVSVDKSYAAGDTYKCGNNEAFRLISDNLAVLVGKKAPSEPTSSDAKQQSNT